jgi:hypothetical protein
MTGSGYAGTCADYISNYPLQCDIPTNASAGLNYIRTETDNHNAGYYLSFTVTTPASTPTPTDTLSPTSTALPSLGTFSPGDPITIVWPNFGQGFESAYWDESDGVIYNELPGNGNFGGGRCSNYVTNGSPLTAQCFIPGSATLGEHTITANAYANPTTVQNLGAVFYTVLIVPAPTPTVTSTGTSTPTPSATSTATPAAALLVQPTSGTIGHQLTFAGSGFAPSEIITICVDSTTAPALAVTVSSGAGSLAVTHAVPALPFGPHTFIAQGQSSGRTAMAGFTMEPLLRLQPDIGSARSLGTATVFGFGAVETVLLHWDTPAGPAIKSTVTGRTGVAAMDFTVPAGAPPGRHLVYAVGQVSRAEAVALFTVP